MVTACGAEPVAYAMVKISNTVEESTEFGPRIIMVNLNLTYRWINCSMQR